MSDRKDGLIFALQRKVTAERKKPQPAMGFPELGGMT